MREKIIQEAMHQFQLSGLKFTMNDVATTMHIAKKTIYQFFASKEELLNAMLDYGFDEIQNEKRKILESDLPLKERLRRVMISMPDQYQVLDFRMLSDLHEKYPEVSDNLKRHIESDWDPVLQLIQEGIRTEELRNINVPVLRMMVTSAIEQFLSSDALKTEGIGYHQALDAMMDIIMKGISNEKNQ